jgi:hypothetical protein
MTLIIQQKNGNLYSLNRIILNTKTDVKMDNWALGQSICYYLACFTTTKSYVTFMFKLHFLQSNK